MCSKPHPKSRYRDGAVPAVGNGVWVSRSSTQSQHPAMLSPGVVNSRVPLFGSDAPLSTAVEMPFVGSNHCAVTGAENFDKSTVIVVAFGM